MFTIAERFCLRRCGMSDALKWIGPARFVDNSASTCGRLRPVRKSIAHWMPALLTRIFRAGKPEASHSRSDFLDAALETSQTRVCNPGNCFFADWSRLIRRPQITTSFPRLINSWARAKPIPVPPPVIRTVLPDVFKFSLTLGIASGKRTAATKYRSPLAGYAGCNEISCSLFAPKDEKWRASSVAAYCRATRRSRVALNFWRAVDPANEIDQSTLSEPRIVSAGVRFPDAGMNA